MMRWFSSSICVEGSKKQPSTICRSMAKSVNAREARSVIAANTVEVSGEPVA